MLDVLNNWFQNGNQQAQQQMPNLRQSWLNQFLQQQPTQQAQMPQQQMPQMPMQNGMSPNFRQQLYLQNLMNQQSQGYGSPYSPSYNPNNLPPGAGQNLNPPVRGEVPSPSLAPQQAAPKPAGTSQMSYTDIYNYLNSAPVGGALSPDNLRTYNLTLGKSNPYFIPKGWIFNPTTGNYVREV